MSKETLTALKTALSEADDAGDLDGIDDATVSDFMLAVDAAVAGVVPATVTAAAPELYASLKSTLDWIGDQKRLGLLRSADSPAAIEVLTAAKKALDAAEKTEEPEAVEEGLKP